MSCRAFALALTIAAVVCVGRGAARGDDAGAMIDVGVAIDAGVMDGGVAIDATPAPVDAAPPIDAAPAASVDVSLDNGGGTHAPTDTKSRAWVVIKLVGGLVALLVLAYLGGHRRVVRLQERLGIGGVIAAGFPFIFLGLIARQPEVGVLTEDVLVRLQPILHFGLGWLGFIIGAQLDIRVLDKVPTGTAYLILVEALAPFAVTAVAVGAAMITIGGASWDDPTFWRDMILLGAAAAMTAPRRFRGFANRTWREGRGVDHLLAQLDEIVGVVGLLFVAAYFRPEVTVGWQLPGTAWVFVSIGLGVVIGVLIFAMVRVPVSNAEFLAVVIGSIAFGAGLAGYLFLSPIVVCFIAGALVTNFPCEQRESIFRILNHLERPIHLLFLIIVGAAWDVFDWRGWVLVPMFVAARVVGKWLGIFAAKQTVGKDLPQGYADQRAMVTPVSALAIALVISVHGLGSNIVELTTGDHVTTALWMTTVVLGGAILTELLVTITSPPTPAARPRTAVLSEAGGTPITVDPPAGVVVDELDEPEPTRDDGPVYHDDDSLPPMVPREPTLTFKKKKPE
jgi:Kef-type K+ transport system membrane component KefB